jgi:methionine-gamma-lyase
MDNRMHIETQMLAYGYDPALSEGAIKPPIFQSSTFAFRSAEEGKAFFELAYGLREPSDGESPGLIYSRLNNPNLEILEDRLALWDAAEDCLVFGSGMGAISTTILALLSPGDVLLYSTPVYGGVDHLMTQVLPRWGIRPVPFLASADRQEMTAALDAELARASGRLAMIYVETPANPTNALVDIRLCAEIAAAYSPAGAPNRRALVAVDNTFLGPLFQHPLAHGADLVLYSATKYIGGHSDVIAGACLGSAALMAPVRTMRTFLGAIASPWTGWLLLRSLETLDVRCHRQVETAWVVATHLRSHPAVTCVRYLGFLVPSGPQHAIYERQCLAPGATFAFEVAGGQAAAFRFLNALRLIKLAVSLGGTESLIEHPGTMTHADIPCAAQERMGITPGLVRLSVGLEHPDDLIADLDQALEERVLP